MLEALLAHARSGRVTGLVFAAYTNKGCHGIGITGTYETDILAALACLARLQFLANSKQEPAAFGLTSDFLPASHT